MKLGLDFTPTPPPEDGATGTATQNCIDTSRREQLAPYVAPVARVYVSKSSGSAAVWRFDFSAANAARIVGVTALVLVVTTAVTAAVGLRMVRPLRALTDAVRRPGQTHVPLPVAADDEIGRLTRAFNDLSAYRERMEEQRKAMVSDIAHELRTPPTTIRGWLEATQDGVLSAEDEVTASLLARVSRIWSAVLVRTKGLGSAFQALIQARMSASRSTTERWAERRSFRLISSANQRSTRLSQELLVGVKCRWNRRCLSSQAFTAGVLWVAYSGGTRRNSACRAG